MDRPLFSKKNKWFLSGLSIVCLLAFFFTVGYIHKIHRTSKKKHKISHCTSECSALFSATTNGNSALILGGAFCPPQLYKIPFADEQGIVLGSRELPVRNVSAPYNPSLVENPSGGYFLFFRYDVSAYRGKQPYHTFIGFSELDQKFEQTEKDFKKISTGSSYSEDPRVIKKGNEVFLIYNDLTDTRPYCRSMHLAKIDTKNGKLDYVTNLDLQMHWVEKNWNPFVYQQDSKEILCFEYTLSPHKILYLPNPQENQFIQPAFDRKAVFEHLSWTLTWGELRGGTPAKKIGNQYLAFFHSALKDKNGLAWYFMGAYTFEDKPPFRITAISPHPILFKGIYDTPMRHIANPMVRVIFPSGFVLEHKDGKNLIHVVCGENDSGIKLVTFDQEALLKSLEKL